MHFFELVGLTKEGMKILEQDLQKGEFLASVHKPEGVKYYTNSKRITESFFRLESGSTVVTIEIHDIF